MSPGRTCLGLNTIGGWVLSGPTTGSLGFRLLDRQRPFECYVSRFPCRSDSHESRKRSTPHSIQNGFLSLVLFPQGPTVRSRILTATEKRMIETLELVGWLEETCRQRNIHLLKIFGRISISSNWIFIINWVFQCKSLPFLYKRF